MGLCPRCGAAIEPTWRLVDDVEVAAFSPEPSLTVTVSAEHPLWTVLMSAFAIAYAAGIPILVIAKESFIHSTTVDTIILVVIFFPIVMGVWASTGRIRLEIDEGRRLLRISRIRRFSSDKHEYAPLEGLQDVTVQIDDPVADGTDYVILLHYLPDGIKKMKLSCGGKSPVRKLGDAIARQVPGKHGATVLG